MTYQKFNKDSVVFYQGDVGDSFYIIITGTLSVHVKPQEDRSGDGGSTSGYHRIGAPAPARRIPHAACRTPHAARRILHTGWRPHR